MAIQQLKLTYRFLIKKVKTVKARDEKSVPRTSMLKSKEPLGHRARHRHGRLAGAERKIGAVPPFANIFSVDFT